MENNKKQKFPYLSEEKIREVYEVFDTLHQANSPYLDHYPYKKDFYDSTEPFKKLSILKYCPLRVTGTS